MPLCEDCLKNDGVLLPMIAQGEETHKGIEYVILVCILGCGSSIRVKKSKETTPQ